MDEVGYHQVFTFIYSKREGTPAASMDDDTPREVIQQRFDRLVDLVQQRAFEANQRDLGSTVDVLVEGPRHPARPTSPKRWLSSWAER